VPYYRRPMRLIGSLYLVNLYPNEFFTEGSLELEVEIPDRDHACVKYARHGHPVIEVPLSGAPVLAGAITPWLENMSGEQRVASAARSHQDQPEVVRLALAPLSSADR
jgi:hypothetical protein